jgi:hypothetical protein
MEEKSLEGTEVIKATNLSLISAALIPAKRPDFS